MRTDLWGWFNRYAVEAFLEGNLLKQRMTQVYDMGWEALRAERLDDALRNFSEGLRTARALEEPCWELFFEYWFAETLIFYKSDYQTGLEHAIRMGARAHQEAYLECPVRGRVYYTLMYVYYAMDSIGYEDKVREIIEFMEKEIPLDDDTHQRMQYTRAGLEYAKDDYDNAEKEIQYYLSMTVGNAHRQAGGVNMLRQIEYARGNVKQAFDHAYTSERNARMARLENSVANALLWQAVCAIRLGQNERAAELHQRGLAHYERFQLKKLPSYYNAVCEYLELAGKVDEARSLREHELATINVLGSIDYTAYAHLAYARLLGRLGEDVSQAIDNCKLAAEKLLKPDFFLAKVQKVEDGDYYKYDWQGDGD